VTALSVVFRFGVFRFGVFRFGVFRFGVFRFGVFRFGVFRFGEDGRAGIFPVKGVVKPVCLAGTFRSSHAGGLPPRSAPEKSPDLCVTNPYVAMKFRLFV
jgi:hypothetical protein